MPFKQYLTDRKSTRLNSSHLGISYAVFCLKKTHQQRPQSPEAREAAAPPAGGRSPPSPRAAGTPADPPTLLIAPGRPRSPLQLFFLMDGGPPDFSPLPPPAPLPI